VLFGGAREFSIGDSGLMKHTKDGLDGQPPILHRAFGHPLHPLNPLKPFFQLVDDGVWQTLRATTR
jgi:hypothetical protein